jgi:hypothetical protein
MSSGGDVFTVGCHDTILHHGSPADAVDSLLVLRRQVLEVQGGKEK